MPRYLSAGTGVGEKDTVGLDSAKFILNFLLENSAWTTGCTDILRILELDIFLP